MIASLLHLFFPSRCAICGRRLEEDEEDICTSCFFELPLQEEHHRESDDALLEYFHELINVEKAKVLMEYRPDSAGARLMMALKYENRQKLGLRLGEMMANYWLDSGFFKNIDLIVPVPLAKDRERRRGYNQSRLIAEGLARATGLPVNTAGLVRSISNPSQTSLSDYERQKNTEGIFSLLSPEDFAHRHILLVDDVITTGATLKSAAKEMAKAGGVRFSFAAVAKTKRSLK